MTAQDFISIGAGGISFLVLIGLIGYIIKTIHPLLTEIKAENSAYKEVIRNNTEAIKEISRSNDNIASALALLTQSFAEIDRGIHKQGEKFDHLSSEVTKISERTKNCLQVRERR